MLLVDKLNALLPAIINGMGYTFVGVEVSAHKGNSLIRIYIDHADSKVNLDACKLVSEQVHAILNVELDFIGKYMLEISSPGMDRKFFNLEQCRPFIGRVVKIRLKEKDAFGRKVFKARLHSIAGESLVLLNNDQEQEQEVLFDEVIEIRLVPEWDNNFVER